MEPMAVADFDLVNMFGNVELLSVRKSPSSVTFPRPALGPTGDSRRTLSLSFPQAQAGAPIVSPSRETCLEPSPVRPSSAQHGRRASLSSPRPPSSTRACAMSGMLMMDRRLSAPPSFDFWLRALDLALLSSVTVRSTARIFHEVFSLVHVAQSARLKVQDLRAQLRVWCALSKLSFF